jgi:hypothetical protein
VALATDGLATQVESARSADQAAAIKAQLADQRSDGANVEASNAVAPTQPAKVTLLGQTQQRVAPPATMLVNPNVERTANVKPLIASKKAVRQGAVRGARACDHSIALSDSYGDGWNGNSVDVLVNGAVVLDDLTLAAGLGPEVTVFQADTGDVIQVIFNATGLYTSECSYIVSDVNGTPLCADGQGGTVPIGCTATGFCGSDPCIGNEPANDDCLTAEVVNTFPATVTGDTECAAIDCPGDLDYNAVWYEVQLPYASNNLSLDYCGGPEQIFTVSAIYFPTCPGDCTAWVGFDNGAFVDCPGADPNIDPQYPQLEFLQIPGPGSIYVPVNVLGPDGLPKAFQLTIDVVESDPYCLSGATSTIDSAVEGVILNTISNPTVDECATYSDFTALSTDLQQNGTYTIEIWSGDCDGGSTFNRWARAWIDFNQDGDLEDAGELIYDQGGVSNGDYDVLTGNFTVPITATLGATRMRVLVRETSTAPPPCGTFTYGETEDYTVNIIEAPPFGACCLGAQCLVQDEFSCLGLGGNYLGNGTDCDPNPCVGACCQLDGSCVVTTAADCATGLFEGGGTVCDPNPCVQPCPCPSTLTPPVCDDLEPLDPNTPVYGGPWMQVTGDGGDWTWDSGGTPSSGTGPSVDHTLGTAAGHYFFTESSGFNNKVFILESPCFDLTGIASPALSFYYHMLGATMGTLSVEITDNNCITWTEVFSVSGNQGDEWFGALVDLSAYTGIVKIRFVGLTGSSFTSDMAIDDICVLDAGNITGACCYPDGSCLVSSPADCTAAGGAFAGPGTTCDPNNCPQPGRCCLTDGSCMMLLQAACADQGGFFTQDLDCTTACPDPAIGNDCTAPILVTLPAMLDYRDDNYTCGRGDNYNVDTGIETCLSTLYDGGEDIIYEVTVTEAVCVDILLASNVGQNYVGLGIGTACPLPTTCLYEFTSGSSQGFLAEGVVLPAGVYYFMIDTWPAPPCWSNYTLLMTASTACSQGACCFGDPVACQVVFEDECTLLGGAFAGDGSVCGGLDCNNNGIDDACDILAGLEPDCNGNGVPDSCDIGTVSTDVD